MKKQFTLMMLLAALLLPWVTQAQDPCTPISTFPVTYGFEASEGFTTTVTTAAACTTNVFGACWRNEQTTFFGSTGSGRIWHIYSGTTVHGGAHSLMLPDKGSSSAGVSKTMLTFPPMDFTNSGGYVVSFWIYRPGTSTTNPEGFKIYASTTDTIGPNAIELGHYSRHYTMPYPCIESASGWYQYETSPITLTGTVYIIFEGQSYYGASTYIDDVVIMEAPTCIKVSNLAIDASQTTTSSLTLTWQDQFNSSPSYNIYMLTATDTTLVQSGVTDTTYTVTGLNSGTNYTFAVVTDCGGGDTSVFSTTASAYTGCATITAADLPYTEDFESYGTGAAYGISPCWHKGTNNSTAYPYPYGTAGINSTRGLSFYSYRPSSATSTQYYSWAAMPPVDDALDMSDLMVSFKVKRYSTASNYYTTMLCVGIADSVTAFTSASVLDTSVVWIDTVDLFSATASSIHEIEVSFDSYAGDGKYVVFYAPIPSLHGSGTYCYNYVYLDDVMLRPLPTCFRPEELVLDSIFTTEAYFSWTPDERTTAPSGWHIEYGPAGFTPGTGTTDDVYDTNYSITSLTPNTEYDLYVYADCGSEMSDGRMLTFRTRCVAIDSLPYTQTFEDAATGGTSSTVFVNCMNRLNNGSSYFGYPYVSATAAYNHTPGGSKGLYWYNATTTGTYGDYQIVVLPAVDTNIYPINTLQLRFWARATGTSYNPVFQVGVMTDPENAGTFVPVEAVNVGANTTYSEFTVALGTYTGNGQYVAIRALRPSTAWYATVDDITLETMPPCPAVTNIEANATVGAALLTWDWQAGYDAPGNYTIVYDSIGGTSPTTLTTTTNSAVITGLEANTEYKAYVQANCGDDGMGRMDSITFATNDFGCAVFDPASTFSDTINVGTSTSTYFPSYSLYNYGLTQQIYTAAEIGHGCNISSISIKMNAVSQQRTFEVYMGHTTSATATAFINPSDLVCVYNGGNIPLAASSWVTFNLTTPFSYNGTDNLVVFFRDMTGSYVSGNSCYGTTSGASGCSRYVYQDGSPYTVGSTTGGTSSSFRPMIVLAGASCLQQATCANPSVMVTEMDTADVTIAWAPGYNEASWDVYYRVAGDTAWITEASAVSTNSYTFTGLFPATDYEFRVGFTCSDGTDYFGVATATTPCAPLALPYTENFDAITTSTTAANNYGVMPNCWDYELTGTSTYTTGTYLPGVYYSTSYSSSGSYCLRLAGQGYFMLPEFSTTVDSLMVSFNAYITSANYQNLVIGAMENSMFVPIDTVELPLISQHNYVVVSLSGYTGTSRNIAFFNPNTTSTTYYSYVYIDDLRVEIIPDCPRPVTVDLVAVTDSMLTFTWDSLSDGYDVVLSSSLVDPDTVSAPVFVATDTISFTGLTPNTEYYAYVRSVCGIAGHSDWSNVLTMRTACSPLPLPYTEDFESYGSGSANPISPCWVKGTNSATAYPYPTSTAPTGARSLYFYAYHPSTATAMSYYSYAALPMFQDSVNRLMLSFNVRTYSSTNNYYTTCLQVGVMDNPYDISTFVPVDTISFLGAPASSVHGVEVLFNNYTGNGRYIAIYDAVPPLFGANYDYSYAYVDDIVVDTIPSCPRPNNVSFTGIGQTSATVHWNGASDALGFEIEYGPAGFTQGFGTTVTSAVDTVDIIGLNPSTDYDVYVRALCTGSDTSNWSFVQSFSTLCGPMALPISYDPDRYLTGTTSPLPNCWTRTNNATGSTNYYPYIYSSSANAHTGNNVLYYYFSTSSGYANEELMAFPEIDVVNFPMNTLEVSFWAKSSVANKPFVVGVMTDPTSMSTFQSVDTVVLTTAVSEYTIDFSNYVGIGTYVALKGTMDGTSSYYIYVDDINIGLQPHCPRAYNLSATNATATTAELSWTDTIGSTQWAVQYRLLNDTATTTVTANSNPFTLTGLTANTHYYYRVAPICSDGVQSDWSNSGYSFSTSQVPATVPYSYDFETSSEWANWQTASNNTVNWSRGNAASGNTGYAMYLSTDNGTTQGWNLSAITNAGAYRDFDFGPTPGSYELNFRALIGGSTDGNYDGITVMVVDPTVIVESSSTGLTSPWGHISTVDVRMDTVWTNESVYLDGMSGVKRLVFFHFNQATASSHPYVDIPDAIDDITIGLQPCARPYDLSVSNITSNMAYLTWDGPATDTYVVAYRVYGAAASTNVFDTITGNHYTFTGLASSTNYVAWVSHICSMTATDTTASDWSNGIRFSTVCPATALPYLETFDSVPATTYSTAGQLPDCWEGFSNGTSAAYMPHVVGSGSYWYSVNNTPALTMTSGSSSYGDTKIVALPPFDAPVNACGIRFYYRHENLSYGQLEIGYVTGNDLENTFHAILALPACTTMTQIDSTLLTSAPANAQRIALRWTHSASFYSVGIDNIEVWAADLCPTPAIASANANDHQSATITVTGGSNYDLVYGADIAAMNDTISNTTGIFNISGLMPATQYFFAVRQHCDSATVSNWNQGTFTTDSLPCFVPDSLTVMATTFNSATISWVSNAAAWELHVVGASLDSVYTATTNPFVIGGLYQGTQYNVSVRSICMAGVEESDYSDPITVTTNACNMPEGVTVSNVTYQSAEVSWQAVSGAQGYNVYWGEPQFYFNLVTPVPVTGTSYTITGLEAESPYEVVVVTRCTESLEASPTDNDRIGFTTGQAGIYDVESGTLTLYPNPATTSVSVNVTGMSGNVTLQIVDMNGRTVYSQSGSNEFKIDVSSLAQGAYFVRVTSEQQTAVRKLIVK